MTDLEKATQLAKDYGIPVYYNLHKGTGCIKCTIGLFRLLDIKIQINKRECMDNPATAPTIILHEMGHYFNELHEQEPGDVYDHHIIKGSCRSRLNKYERMAWETAFDLAVMLDIKLDYKMFRRSLEGYGYEMPYDPDLFEDYQDVAA